MFKEKSSQNKRGKTEQTMHVDEWPMSAQDLML
jgi:hypothetical protein